LGHVLRLSHFSYVLEGNALLVGIDEANAEWPTARPRKDVRPIGFMSLSDGEVRNPLGKTTAKSDALELIFLRV